MGVPVEHHEEFHQREWRPGLAVLIARKRIGASAEDRGLLPLVERELLTTRAMKPGSTMEAFTCLLNSSIAALTFSLLSSMEDRY